MKKAMCSGIDPNQADGLRKPCFFAQWAARPFSVSWQNEPSCTQETKIEFEELVQMRQRQQQKQ